MTIAERRARPTLTLEPTSQADPSDELIFVYRPAGSDSNIAARLRAALANERWLGAGVVYAHKSGAVTASVLGVTGFGPNSGAALLDLERRLDGETYP